MLSQPSVRSPFGKSRVTIGAALFSQALLFALPAPSDATVITRTFDFTAINFNSIPAGGIVPVDPVIGSFTVTWDNGADVFDLSTGGTSSGIVLNGINISPGSPLAFGYSVAGDFMRLGGFTSGIGGVGGTVDDFVLDILGASSTTPNYGPFGYAVTGGTFGYVTLNVQATAVPSSVSEPGSLSLLAAAFMCFGLGLKGWRKA